MRSWLPSPDMRTISLGIGPICVQMLRDLRSYLTASGP
jgi:hypothetical protein